MRKYVIIGACLATLVASTQTSGLMRSLIELSAFLGLLWLALTGTSAKPKKTTHNRLGRTYSQ